MNVYVFLACLKVQLLMLRMLTWDEVMHRGLMSRDHVTTGFASCHGDRHGILCHCQEPHMTAERFYTFNIPS